MTVSASLGPRTSGAWTYGQTDTSELVKADLNRSKNDANDAAAICQAVTRPSMRFVPVKRRRSSSRFDAAPDPTIAGAPAYQC